MIRKILSSAVALTCLVVLPAHAETNIMFIVDASGSMKEKVGEQTRMDAAKEVLSKTLGNMPENANLGLLVYGHRTAKDCTDIELVSPIGGDDAATLKKTVSGLVAKGETPIAESIKQASKSFSTFKGQDNKIILVTDGLEECKGDPCAAAKEAKASGLDVVIDVVGFTLGDEEAKAVQCITEVTGGKYYGAADVDALTTALQEAAVEPEPVSTIAFEDDFDGTELAEHWDVLNSNPDQYIVENGELLFIGKDIGGLSNAESSNILRLMEDLPSGDWTITLKVKPEFQTGHDQLSFGLYTDNQNYVATNIYATDNFCCRVGNKTHNIVLQTVKVSKGEKTMFEDRTREMLDSGTNDFKTFVDTKNANKEFTVKLIKKGRNYYSMLHYDGTKDEQGSSLWVKTDVVSSLRAPKLLVINAGQTESVDGESLFRIHSVKIEASE